MTQKGRFNTTIGKFHFSSKFTDSSGVKLPIHPSYLAVAAMEQLLYVTDPESLSAFVFDIKGTCVGEYKAKDPHVIFFDDKSGCIYYCVKRQNATSLQSGYNTSIVNSLSYI